MCLMSVLHLWRMGFNQTKCVLSFGSFKISIVNLICKQIWEPLPKYVTNNTERRTKIENTVEESFLKMK